MKLSCKTCGLLIPPANVNLAEGICFCPGCNESFRLTTANVSDEMTSGVGRPAGTGIEFVADVETLGLIIPPGNNRRLRNLWVGWAAAINVLAAILVVSALWPRSSVSVGGACFVVVLGALVAALALFLARGEFTLAINRRECTAIWALFHWSHLKRVPTPQITDVVLHEIYTVNEQPRYAILIKHPMGSILFGATLTNEERRWLTDEIRRFLGKDDPSRIQAVEHESTS
ncbi:MAG: hypothetical protein Q7S40_26815 [Opitutaceae bacterium]|nr:hypothetical protein [Opitutaceae bacterium]